MTFTCEVYDGFLLRWNSPLITQILYALADSVPTTTPRSPFFATLTNRTGSGPANFTSTLQVNASRNFSDTTIECRNQASESEQSNFQATG